MRTVLPARSIISLSVFALHPVTEKIKKNVINMFTINTLFLLLSSAYIKLHTHTHSQGDTGHGVIGK
jgi:hypothetical protein